MDIKDSGKISMDDMFLKAEVLVEALPYIRDFNASGYWLWWRKRDKEMGFYFR